MTVEVHDDASALASAVAGELIQRLAAAQARGEVPQVGLTGGSIAEKIHVELGRTGPDSGIDWSRVGFWWGDERYVAADSADRNARSARAAFLDVVGADPALVHEAPATDSGLSLDEAVASYGAEAREVGFEVLMLGVGPDGHVASLFPGHPALDVDDQIAVAVPGSPKPPPERISLTFGALNRSRAVLFVVSGEEKADAVARALAAAGTPGATVAETPARGVTGLPATPEHPASPHHPATDVIWFLDRPAASAL